MGGGSNPTNPLKYALTCTPPYKLLAAYNIQCRIQYCNLNSQYSVIINENVQNRPKKKKKFFN